MNRTLDYLAYRWKAVAAFLAPAATIIAVPMALGGPPMSEDLWKAAAASLVALFAVYATPQTPMPPPTKRTPPVEDLSNLEGEQAEEPIDYPADETEGHEKPGQHKAED